MYIKSSICFYFANKKIYLSDTRKIKIIHIDFFRQNSQKKYFSTIAKMSSIAFALPISTRTAFASRPPFA